MLNDKIAELYIGNKNKFIRKVIIFICVMVAVGTIVAIALLFADYQQTKEAITQMQRIRI